jgi:hypothetical protein
MANPIPYVLLKAGVVGNKGEIVLNAVFDRLRYLGSEPVQLDIVSVCGWIEALGVVFVLKEVKQVLPSRPYER